MAQTIYLSGLIKWLFTWVCPLQGQNLRQTKVGHVVFRPHDICRIAVHLPRVFLNDGRQVDYPDLIDIPWLDVDARPLPRSYTSKNTKRLCFGQSQLCLLQQARNMIRESLSRMETNFFYQNHRTVFYPQTTPSVPQELSIVVPRHSYYQ